MDPTGGVVGFSGECSVGSVETERGGGALAMRSLEFREIRMETPEYEAELELRHRSVTSRWWRMERWWRVCSSAGWRAVG